MCLNPCTASWKARAAQEGKSLSDYLLREIERMAGGAAHAGRTEGAVGPPLARQSAQASCPDHSRGEGQPVIVVDASALMEVLLNRPSGKRVANRLLDPLETLHAPHLL